MLPKETSLVIRISPDTECPKDYIVNAQFLNSFETYR